MIINNSKNVINEKKIIDINDVYIIVLIILV